MAIIGGGSIIKDYLIYYIPTKCETIMVYLSSGDNLIEEDYEAGCNDYVNYYTYFGKVTEEEMLSKEGDWDEGCKDSGMFCFNNEILKYNGVDDLIEAVIDFEYGKPLATILLGCCEDY